MSDTDSLFANPINRQAALPVTPPPIRSNSSIGLTGDGEFAHAERLVNIVGIQDMAGEVLSIPCSPESAHEIIEQGDGGDGLKPAYIGEMLSTLAKAIYYQTKMVKFYHMQVCCDGNELAHLLCAIHFQQPRTRVNSPDTAGHSRSSSDSSDPSSSSSTSPGRARPRFKCDQRKKHTKACDLPDLTGLKTISLGHWEGLYYALIAQISDLHHDMHERLRSGFVKYTDILHNGGPRGVAQDDEPFTVHAFMLLMRAAWNLLTDPRFVVTLDAAVASKNMKYYNSTSGLLEVGKYSPACARLDLRRFFIPQLAKLSKWAYEGQDTVQEAEYENGGED